MNCTRELYFDHLAGASGQVWWDLQCDSRGALRPIIMDTTRFGLGLLAARCTRGLDVVHALGPILLHHLGLGIAERLAQCDEH